MVKLADYIDISELEDSEVAGERLISLREDAKEIENKEKNKEIKESETKDNLTSPEDSAEEKDEASETGTVKEKIAVNVDDVRNLENSDDASTGIGEIAESTLKEEIDKDISKPLTKEGKTDIPSEDSDFFEPEEKQIIEDFNKKLKKDKTKKDKKDPDKSDDKKTDKDDWDTFLDH